jgi:hypothetical protein
MVNCFTPKHNYVTLEIHDSAFDQKVKLLSTCLKYVYDESLLDFLPNSY